MDETRQAHIDNLTARKAMLDAISARLTVMEQDQDAMTRILRGMRSPHGAADIEDEPCRDEAPGPWHYALGAQVRYTLHPTMPYRVIGRTMTQREDRDDTYQYILQPWVFRGQWMPDRPLMVYEAEITPWPTEETHATP